MTLYGVTHIALRVEDLREAELFYSDLFALDVAFREAETPDGWRTARPDSSWNELEQAGIGLVMLHRDGFRLALEAVENVSTDGLLSHIGLYVDSTDLAQICEAAVASECEVLLQREDALVFDDPYRVRWEVNSFDYDDPSQLSTGARTGQWLDIRH